jgi:hypothetical protein
MAAPFTQFQFLTAAELNSAFAQAFPANGVSSYSATLLTGTTQAAWFTALGLTSGAPGFAGGVATLDGGGLVPLAQIPPSLVGALYPQGGWNANTNSPALASGVGTKGFFYVITNGGATTLDGNSVWAIGDCVFFDGTVWRKINGSGNISIPSTNISDSTVAGRAILTAANTAAQRVALNIDQATLAVDTNVTVTAAMEAVVWTSISAPRVASLPAASTFSQGQAIFIYDESGNCSTTNTIAINAAGADTIGGAASYVLSTPYSAVILIRASVAKWTALPFSQFNPAATWITENAAVRQTVTGGPVDATGMPAFLPATSGSLSLISQNISSSTPLVVTSAQGATITSGQSDLTGATSANISWGPLTANTTNYLGVTVNANGTLTPFFTTIAPVYQEGTSPAASIVNGAITFIKSSMLCYQGNGSAAVQVSAVLVGQAVTATSTITSTVAYGYNGNYFSSYVNTLPPAGLTTLNHNLGTMPNLVDVFFKNLTAEANYSVGDVILITAGLTSAAVASFAGFQLTLSNTVVSMTSVGQYATINKTTATGVTLNNANWAYRIIAKRGW